MEITFMRITRIDAIQLRLPEVREIFDGTQDVLVVRVNTDEGVTGYGEVVSASAVAKAAIEAPRSAPRRHGLAVALAGADPMNPEDCWNIMYEASRWHGRQGVVLHAMSGIDQALWDIVGKVTAKPLADIWGRKRSRLRAYASVLFPPTVDEARTLTDEILQQGFTAVKFGYGSFGLDRTHDCHLLDAIYGVARGHAEIMVDAGRVWSAHVAIDRARELFERYNITFLEEPLHEDDLMGYAQLTRTVPGRIAAGETEATLGAFQRLIEAGLTVIQPDVGRAGSLAICRKVSELARETGAWCVAHCFGTGINLAASLHWMASADDAPFIEFPLTKSVLRTSLVPDAPRQKDGWVALPDRPGLGIEIDERILRKYAYPPS
jgi:L-rhamnonate dehydratase